MVTTAYATFVDLPNELLLQILHPFPLQHLLPLAGVSHRLANLVLRIYHARLNHAAALTPRQLILECYHPSLRLTEETLHCAPQGTPNLAKHFQELAQGESVAQRLHAYSSLYSRFRPYHRSQRRRLFIHPAGDVPGSRTWSDTAHLASTSVEPSAPSSPTSEITALPYVKQQVNLDAHEAFTQLKAVTTLVQAHPRTGAFGSMVDVSDGVVRLFKSWLREQAHRDAEATREDAVVDKEEDEGTLYVNDGSKVGITLCVRARRWRRDAQPILQHVDEVDADEAPASFDIELRQVRVRTCHLLDSTEKSVAVQHAAEGRAVVLGAW